ncbi:hypothetical protein PPSIR1_30786 [Plesiocystis pacifica SIR-1]|uniref:Bpu10I restriction endonuclease beta subunit n=1 Tax=Plesiocystis pacifica SIR-1 TaxID=391625 RepID=A6GAH0_9BACT|nr:Bpu10I family restriction endonuclease [Plesiocystis pacifica]EDM77158.1 hypothetical protein PPSIR1_30786 [Plesiocystis pacifica SIR-1]
MMSEMGMSLPKLPTPHGEKLAALRENSKLPEVDRERVDKARKVYEMWRESCLCVSGTREQVIQALVAQLQQYKRYIDLELIFDSPADWLYRQKGQTKLDNSIIEEFLPILVTSVFGEDLADDIFELGPTTCFSNLRFESSIVELSKGAGAAVKSKDQDFAISRPVFLKTSHHKDFRNATTHETRIAYVAAECKTNLDKTMFQEAAATAQDVKTAVPGAKYFLLCEWLDMTPISTSVTPIDEILLMRRAKRLPSSARKSFSKAADRKANRGTFIEYLDGNPFSSKVFERLLSHIEQVVRADGLDTNKALSDGFF